MVPPPPGLVGASKEAFRPRAKPKYENKLRLVKKDGGSRQGEAANQGSPSPRSGHIRLWPLGWLTSYNNRPQLSRPKGCSSRAASSKSPKFDLVDASNPGFQIRRPRPLEAPALLPHPTSAQRALGSYRSGS